MSALQNISPSIPGFAENYSHLTPPASASLDCMEFEVRSALQAKKETIRAIVTLFDPDFAEEEMGPVVWSRLAAIDKKFSATVWSTLYETNAFLRLNDLQELQRSVKLEAISQLARSLPAEKDDPVWQRLEEISFSALATQSVLVGVEIIDIEVLNNFSRGCDSSSPSRTLSERTNPSRRTARSAIQVKSQSPSTMGKRYANPSSDSREVERSIDNVTEQQSGVERSEKSDSKKLKHVTTIDTKRVGLVDNQLGRIRWMKEAHFPDSAEYEQKKIADANREISLWANALREERNASLHQLASQVRRVGHTVERGSRELRELREFETTTEGIAESLSEERELIETGSDTVFSALNTYFHDEDFDPKLASQPTSAVPGSAEKLAVLARRVRLGQTLFHPEDKADFSGAHFRLMQQK